MTKEQSQDLDEIYLSERSVEYMKQYDIEFDYDFGRFLGIFLRGGTFKQPLKRSINFFISGYGRDFAKEVRKFLLTYLRGREINCISTMNPDSSETIVVENNLFAVFLSHLLIRNNELVVDNIRSEEHTSELQSRGHLVCRLLLEKKKKK